MGTYGWYSSISRPRQYSGNCGPGTLVVTVLTERWVARRCARRPARDTRPTTIGGARLPMWVTISAGLGHV